MQYYLLAMRRSFDFHGRSSRMEFWIFELSLLIINVVLALIEAQMGYGLFEDRAGPLTAISGLVHFFASLSIAVRRFHDIDRTGWWLLLAFTGIGIIVLIIFWCLPGTRGANQYGPDPLEGSGGAQPYMPAR